MKPIPTSRHTVAVIIFVAIAALVGAMAMVDEQLTDEQVNVAVNALRAQHPHLYSQDPVFGESGLWKFYTPLWQAYLQKAYAVSGDVLLGFRVLAGPLTLIYLLGMYGLLFQQCRSWSVACYTAVLSTAVIFVLGRGYWGLGPLSTMSAETVFLAVAPLLAWGLVQWKDSVLVLLVFVAAGLLANVHVVTGMNFTLVLGVALAGAHRLSFKGIAMALAGFICAAAAASPFLAHFWTVRETLAAGNGAIHEWSAVAQAFDRGELTLLYPTVLVDVLESLGYTLVLWIPAVIVLLRSERFRTRNMRVWVYMLAGGLIVGLGLHGVSQIIGVLRGSPPPVIDFVFALRLTLLPLYVLFAQAVVHLLRLRIGWLHVAAQMLLATLIVLWFVPSFNFRPVRHKVEAMISNAIAEDPWESVQRRKLRREADQELTAIGSYLRDHSDPQDVLIARDGRLRLWAQRALVACPTDIKYYYYLSARDLHAWSRLIEEQRQLLDPPSGGPVELDDLLTFARRHGASYIVVRAHAVLEAQGTWPYETSPHRAWGRHWKLLAVRETSLTTETRPVLP